MGYGYDLMLEIAYPSPLRNCAKKIEMDGEIRSALQQYQNRQCELPHLMLYETTLIRLEL